MNKKEWESELKKYTSALPKAEQDRIIEYYEELFADRLESGKSERQIIGEFGNPADAALQIMTQYGMGVIAPDEGGVAPLDVSSPVKEKKVPTPDFWAGRAGKVENRPENKAPVQSVKSEPSKQEKKEKPKKAGGAKTVLLLIEILLLGVLALGILIVVWAAVAAVLAVGYSLTAGALYAAVCGCMPSIALGVRIVSFAIAFVAVGIALLVIPYTKKIIVAGAKTSKGVCKLFFGWYKA